MHAGEERRSAFEAERKKRETEGENGQTDEGNEMLIYEYKVDTRRAQEVAIDEAIRVTQFIRNKCLRLWMETRGISRSDLQCYCAALAREYPFARSLNSQARQAAADRAWFAIARFYDTCKKHTPGKKGYPRFQHDNRSVEYKLTGWKLEPDGTHLTFTDGCGIGRVRLVGSAGQQIKRVRLLTRADGYYLQFAVQTDRMIEHVPTGKKVGIDVGLRAYYTNSQGNTVANPLHYRTAEKRLKRLQRRLSRTHKKSKNRLKARQRVAKAHLKVQRQREDFARKTANALVTSHDQIAYEHLQIRNKIRNRRLAKSIHDAGWGTFLRWVRYYGVLHDIPVVAVELQYTSQDCSACATRVKKSLSVRTHICPKCGVVLDRDHNAALNILAKALKDIDGTLGHRETAGSAEPGTPGER
jgi:putative transposase